MVIWLWLLGQARCGSPQKKGVLSHIAFLSSFPPSCLPAFLLSSPPLPSSSSFLHHLPSFLLPAFIVFLPSSCGVRVYTRVLVRNYFRCPCIREADLRPSI